MLNFSQRTQDLSNNFPRLCTVNVDLTSNSRPLSRCCKFAPIVMMTEQRKAVIKNADMSENMQQDAVDCASQALAKYNIEKVRAVASCCGIVELLFVSHDHPGRCGVHQARI